MSDRLRNILDKKGFINCGSYGWKSRETFDYNGEKHPCVRFELDYKELVYTSYKFDKNDNMVPQEVRIPHDELKLIIELMLEEKDLTLGFVEVE